MRTGFFALAALLIAPLSTFAADPPVVFQTQPPGRILSDVRAVAKMIGGEKAAAGINDALKAKLGDKGFEGLAIDKPILGYAFLSAKIEEIVLVVAVPVTGEKDFLALLERIGGQAPPKPDDKGVYEFTKDGDDASVLMKFDSQHAYFAIGKDPSAALDAKALVAPVKLYDPADKSLASVKVSFDKLPKEVRDQIGVALKEIKSKLDELRLPPDAGDAARKAVDELIKLGNRYADLLQDAQSAGARLILDPNTGEAAVEVGLAGKPGSALSKIIAERKPSTNKFAGLVTPDSVLGLKLQLPLFAKEIQSAAVIGLEAGQKQLAEMAPPQFKGLIDETFKGLVRTVNDGEFDVALSLRGPDKNGLYTVVGAVAFEDPSAVEKELRALFKTELPPEVKGFFNLDVAQVGKTNIHQVKVGGLLPPEVQKVFGDEASFTFAFAPKGIFLAFGPDAVNVLKTALEVKTGPSPAFEISLNPSRLAKLIVAAGKEAPAGFGSQDKLIPAVVLTLDGGKELRLRLGTNLGWLEGLGASLIEAAGGASAPPVKVKD